ncbi:ankyrin repeat domain-containing protein [Wolbachia endosymbiont (group B) of Phalera bucephala]|uniref:ankyrin repeat domain-containing protein n=2 Tax=unclassified Wolbachia TaxID=2640676 RepID=UPI0022303488|nr:ankyrin repeat domain-containing protein [Wolbachia endosymbiont (group B) of Phalera bucephala]
MVNNDQQQEKPQDFELMELLFGKVDSSTSDSLDKSFEARYQSLVDQIQSYLHSSEKPGFFPHRFLGSFSSVLDTKLNDKLGIKKLHFRFEGARTLKVVAETESKIHVFIFTEDIEAQHSKQTNTKNFEFTTGEWKNVMGRDYTKSDAHKLQIDVIKILKDKYELVKSRSKSDKDVKSKKLYLYLRNNVLKCKAKDVYGNTQTIQIGPDELKGNNAFKNKFFDEIKQFLDKSGKDLSDDVRKELSRITSAKGYTLKSDGEDEKINIKVESKKKIVDQPIEPTVKFQEVTKKLDKSVYLESYIEKLANPDAEIDQVQDNLEKILTYIKEVHTNLDLQGNVYGIKAREAAQHGFVAGIFDNFRYRDNTKLYLEQFAGGGYADIVLLVRGPNRAIDSVPILIELKAGTEGQVDPSDALEQAKDYIKGFRPNKMRILTNADNAIAVGLNLDDAEPFKTEVQPIKQPPAPLMEEFIELVGEWDNQQISEEDFKQEITDLLSSEYHTFPANKETKDHYYFSRDILGQSILINKIGQDQSNIKKYIYSYGEYPLDWSGGTEYTLSKSPVMTLIFVQGNEGQENTAFIFHIRESNTKEFYADKKIPVLNIPEIGRVGNVIEIKMSLKKYETGLSFEDLFEIEQISKYESSGNDQQFTDGKFIEIPNSDELKAKFDQAITSQHASDGEVSLQAYKVLLTEVADTIYPIKDLITNEARLQAILNGLFSSYSDLKLQETSAKTVIIPEFQVGAGGRVDMVIQGIGPSPQGAKEYTPIALEFKLIGKNLNQDQLKQEVDKLTKEQNIRYAKGAALKAITDSDKMFFMGVVVNVKAKDKNSLILTSDKFVPALVVHSSIDIAKRKHLEGIQEVTQRLKDMGIQEENLSTLESATAEKDYHYWLQQHDIADIARIEYGYGTDGANTLFEVVGSPKHIANQLQQFQNSVATRGEKRPLTLIVNLDNNHWVTLVISHQNGQYNGYYVDSLGNDIPGNIRQVLERARITVNDVSIAQQTDGHNCGLWALENAHSLNQMIANGYDSDWVRDLLLFNRNEAYFQEQRENISDRLSIDPQRIANLDEAILAETQANRKKFNLNSCVRSGGRSKRSVNPCLFSKSDVEKFSKGKVDENNVDKTIIDSEKFLTYVKNSQDEAKNAQLVEFVGDKSIEGDRKYLLDKVVGDQGYERYVQNERVKNLHGDISQQASSATKGSKLKGRLMNAAGGIQLIRGIHGAIVSCKEGTATDCGLNLGGIGWSFASQPIENVMVKITPKVVASAEKVVGKIIPGTLGKQTKFAIRVVGVKFGSTIARGTAGAVTGVFDIVDIGMSVNNLVDCKKRENSDNPCGEKEIRDNIATISFSTISFVSGVALTALGMPGIGIAVGVALMVASGVYSGVSNIVEYEKKYDTTHDENWRIFWHTFAFQPVPQDVQHLAARKEMVNSLAKGVWKALNNDPSNVVAYSIGLGKINGNTLRPDYATIMMNRTNANTKNLSRVVPDYIKGADRICLPQITNQDYEKGIKSSVKSAVYYCENAMIIDHGGRVKMKQKDKTIVYDLQNVDRGTIAGSNVWNNNFLIYSGTAGITGGNNVANRFVLVNNPSFSGKIIGGSNSTNILDLSQLTKEKVIGVNVDYRFKPSAYGRLKVKINSRLLIDDYVSNNLFNYHYVGRKDKVDKILCMGYSEHFTGTDDRDVIIDSGGGSNNNEKDVVESCKKVIISPYTRVKGRKSNYTFYVKTADYKGRGLYSEIDVDGTGTVSFPEFDLLSDCDQITYSKNSNTLSLKINFGQNNQFTLDIKNYVERSSNKPYFVLIDKNGSNIVPKIERSDSSTIKITSFELHSEHSLKGFRAVENHYKKILNNHKGYKVLSVVRGKTQSQNNSVVSHMVFGSSGDDIINFDQGTMFARGGGGSDVYFISNDINSREVKIDNNSSDKKLDTLFMSAVEKDFSIQQCDLYLKYNNSNIRVKNYFQDPNYRHLIIMNKKGETFIPNIQSMSCSPFSSGKDKLVPFLQATQTQNMFLLPKDFEDDHVVIDSRLEDIEKYKDKDDLLLIRESENPFIIRIEGFYTDRSKWENISYSLWNNNDLFLSSGLLENVDNVVEYKDKLRGDYERIVKEYIEDFSDSTSIIQHNQKLEKNISTSVGQDEERIGVMVLKNITPDQVEVSSSGTDLIFRDKKSNHTININNWNNSESYRISTLEFDLGLEPITIRKLDRFSLPEVRKIQALIDKASENYQNRSKYTPKVENDFKCLISVDDFERENRDPVHQCLGFPSLQDRVSFTESSCSLEQIEELKNKTPSSNQILTLLEKLENNLLLNGYDSNIIDQCNKWMITSGLGVLKPLVSTAIYEGKWDEVKTLLDKTARKSKADVEYKNQCSKNWTTLNHAVYNGNVKLSESIFKSFLEKKGDINALTSCNNDNWALLHYAVHYSNFDMVSFLVDKGANIEIRSKEGQTPLHLAVEEAKQNIINLLLDRGADIEAKNNDGRTPLYLAAYNNDSGVIELLCNRIKTKSNDASKMIKQVGFLKKEVVNQANIPSNAKRLVESCISSLRDSIKSAAKKVLKEGILHSRSASTIELIDKVYNFDERLFNEAIKEAVNDTYAGVGIEGILRFIRSHHYIGQFIPGYIAAFDKIPKNDGAMFKLAYSIRETMKMPRVNSEEKSDLERLKNKLPESVRNAVFSSEVCIKNVEYGRYLYSPNNDCMYHLNNCDRDRRYVFTWPSNGNGDQFKWKVELNGDNVYLKNVEYGRYLYSPNDDCMYHLNNCDRDRRYVFTWPSKLGNNGKWKVELDGGNVYLKNVEYGRYLYSPNNDCMYHLNNCDRDRRYVFTWPSNRNNDQFKWKIEDCGSTRKRRSIQELNGYNQTVVDYQSILTEENSQQIASRISAIVEDVERHTFLNQSKNKLDLDIYLNNRGRSNAADSMRRDVCSELNASGRRNIVLSGNDVCAITSGYETLDIENFPIQEVVINDDVNGKKSLRSTLDLHQLVQQVDRDLSIKPIPTVIKDKSDLLIKLSISATGLQQDVVTVRLKDALVNKWYKKLQIILDNAPMEIDDSLGLKSSFFISDEKIIVVTPQDIEEKNKLVISKKAGQYTYLHDKFSNCIKVNNNFLYHEKYFLM